jgi:thioredoxin 1
MLNELTNANFQNEVTKSKEKVLIYASAPWCGPCKVFSPTVERVSETASVKMFKLNVDNEPGLAAQFKIRSIPTIILIERDVELKRGSGVLSEDKLKRFIEE